MWNVLDIDECEWNNTCDHLCNNTYGSFICSCEEGYQIYAGTHCAGLKYSVMLILRQLLVLFHVQQNKINDAIILIKTLILFYFIAHTTRPAIK